MPLPIYARATADGVQLQLKVVPGASRTRIVGMLGDRLKIQVAAPPEGGKANQAVIACLAIWLGCAKHDIQMVSGATQALKTVLVPARSEWPSLAR
ncbi:MAG: DUF167 domain-containing protein [Planctomycetota bacterium]